MKTIILSLFFLILLGCQQGGGEVSQSRGSKNTDKNKKLQNTTSSTKQLEQEVLSAAEDCNVKKQYERQIENNRKTHTDQEFKKSLKNMKKHIKC